MFDNSKPNIVLLTDVSFHVSLQKSIGAYKVAYELRQAGFEVAVISHLHTFSVEEILYVLSHTVNQNTLFVGVSNTFYYRVDSIADRNKSIIDMAQSGSDAIIPHGPEYNAQLLAHIKSLNPACKLVLGGPLAGLESQNRIYDYLVVGYADNSIVNLAKHLQDPSVKLEKSHKSVFGPVVVNDKTASEFDFASSHMRYADHDGILPGETLVIEIGRGCIFRCAFCSYPLNGKKKFDYIKHEQTLVDEFMENYTRFGVTQYMFSDDTFNDSVEKCQMIARVAKQLPFELKWWAYLRLDLLAAHPETIDLLVQGGLRAAFFGIETFNKETGSIIGKGASRQKLIDTIELIKAKYQDKVTLHGSFIFGLPRENIQSMQATAEYLLSDQCKLDTWLCFPLRLNDRADVHQVLDPSTNFLSDMELHPEKYGYKFDEAGMWYTEHCSSGDVQVLALELMRKRNARPGARGHGGYMFNISGLGIELDELLNKDLARLDWNMITQKKIERVQLYKRKLYAGLGVPC